MGNPKSRLLQSRNTTSGDLEIIASHESSHEHHGLLVPSNLRRLHRPASLATFTSSHFAQCPAWQARCNGARLRRCQPADAQILLGLRQCQYHLGKLSNVLASPQELPLPLESRRELRDATFFEVSHTADLITKFFPLGTSDIDRFHFLL